MIFKALLIVTTLSGTEYSTPMEDMTSCMDARDVIAKQDVGAEALCIPAVKQDSSEKMKSMFSIMMNFIEKMQEMETKYEGKGETIPFN
tara:strand:+ start:91 stop:357 length:267 start_codon:yes stop_codon:yes gene_type:complete